MPAGTPGGHFFRPKKVPLVSYPALDPAARQCYNMQHTLRVPTVNTSKNYQVINANSPQLSAHWADTARGAATKGDALS